MLHVKYICLFTITILVLTGCASQVEQMDQPQPEPTIDKSSNKHRPGPITKPKVDKRIFHDGATPQILVQAEANASPAGAKLLAQARVMTVDRHVILRGGCWDYINAVWNKAGYPAKNRVNVFKQAKIGPYAKIKNIHAGDWLYFINHSYRNTPHSAMFVAWADRETMRGYTLSYAGQRRREPARYKIYDLTSVYEIIRPRE